MGERYLHSATEVLNVSQPKCSPVKAVGKGRMCVYFPPRHIRNLEPLIGYLSPTEERRMIKKRARATAFGINISWMVSFLILHATSET